jgi:hypothetical protein
MIRAGHVASVGVCHDCHHCGHRRWAAVSPLCAEIVYMLLYHDAPKLIPRRRQRTARKTHVARRTRRPPDCACRRHVVPAVASCEFGGIYQASSSRCVRASARAGVRLQLDIDLSTTSSASSILLAIVRMLSDWWFFFLHASSVLNANFCVRDVPERVRIRIYTELEVVVSAPEIYFCGNCGFKMDTKFAFCTKCGTASASAHMQ